MDYTTLAADELIDRAYSARDEFNALYASNNTDDSTLDRMATLVDELEALQTEADARVALAVRREALASKITEQFGKIPPAFLKNIEKVKAEAAAKKAGAKAKVAAALGETVELQADAPYKEDLTPERAKEIKVTKAVEPENAETTAIEEKAASSKPSLAIGASATSSGTVSIALGSNATSSANQNVSIGFTNVAPIKNMPSKGFGDPLPVGGIPPKPGNIHPGAKVIKPGTVKGLKVPKEQGQVTYAGISEEFADEGATKSEGAAGNFPAGDYAYVPDSTKSSTWKLRLTATPGGDPDPHIVGAAAAALSPGGFRGQKVQIPSADLPKVKAKVAAAWKKANSDKKPDEMPDSLK